MSDVKDADSGCQCVGFHLECAYEHRFRNIELTCAFRTFINFLDPKVVLAMRSSKLCPACGNGNEPGATFCDQCGTHLQSYAVTDSNQCSNCNSSNEPGATFCDQCGNSLKINNLSFCPACNSPVLANDVYCDNCGTQLSQYNVRKVDDYPTKAFPSRGNTEPLHTKTARLHEALSVSDRSEPLYDANNYDETVTKKKRNVGKVDPKVKSVKFFGIALVFLQSLIGDFGERIKVQSWDKGGAVCDERKQW